MAGNRTFSIELPKQEDWATGAFPTPLFCGTADTLTGPHHQANATMRKTRVMPLLRKHSPAKIVVKTLIHREAPLRARTGPEALTVIINPVTTSHRVDALVPDASREHPFLI